MTPAPIPNHQDVSGNIYDVLKAHQRKSGGKTYYAPIDVYLPDHDTPVQPDLIWIAPENVGVIKDTNVQGTPDLVVEILSPGTAQYDRTHKFDQYQVAGVREYWIVDPRDRLIEVYRLDEGRFDRVGAYTDAFKSPLLGINVQVKRLFDG